MRSTMIVSLLALAAACNPKAVDTGDTDGGSTARLTGHSSADSSVSASDADGGAVASDGGEADAEGNYALDVTVGSEGMAGLVVTSSDGAQALVTSTVVEGGTYAVATMDDESSAEAGLFVDISASGSADAQDMAAVLRAVVTADVASAWKDADQAGRTDIAAGFAAAITAWTSGEGDGSLATSVSALVAVEAAADQTSYDTASSSNIDVSAVALAWTDGGYSSVDLSFLAHGAAEAAEGESDDNATLAVFSSLRADRMENAIGADLSVLGAADQGNALDGVDLGGTGDLQATIDAAFDDYSVSVLLAVNSALDVTQQLCMAQAETVAATAHATLVAQVSAASTGDDYASAMATYRGSIDADVYGSLAGCASMDDAEARAVADVLAQAYANTNASI